MNFSLNDYLYVDEFEFRKKKNTLFNGKNHPKAFEVLAMEKITMNTKEAMFRKSACNIKNFPKPKLFEDCGCSDENSAFVLGTVDRTNKFGKSKKLKNKSKKETKKLKKKQEKLNEKLVCFFSEKEIVPGALMAELMKKAERMCVYDKTLFLYDTNMGCFYICDKNDFAVRLNSILDKDVRVRVKSTEYTEVYKQLLMSQDLKYDNVFFENEPFVNCLNGVVNVLTGELLPHDPKYHFKHCINANYIPGAKCPKYLGYLNHLFNGDEELLELIQVAQGYICSHYNNAKKAFLILGQSHTGKSVFHSVIERIIGREFVSHADLSDLCRQEYAASLSGKILNVAPDLKNVPLKDVGFFKSLVSHDDIISTRALYSNPGNVRGETKMLFTSNHMIEFDKSVGEDDVKAVFNRLIYLQVQCKPIDENQENKHLSEELFAERDAIFTWGLQGLKKYIKDGERFPKAKLSEQIKKDNIAKYCPEKAFFDEYIVETQGRYESVTAIKESYEKFCKKIGCPHNGSITKYLERKNIKKCKKRINQYGQQISSGGPIHVYADIRLFRN